MLIVMNSVFRNVAYCINVCNCGLQANTLNKQIQYKSPQTTSLYLYIRNNHFFVEQMRYTCPPFWRHIANSRFGVQQIFDLKNHVRIKIETLKKNPPQNQSKTTCNSNKHD